MANYFEELRRQNSEARKDAFAFTGVAYYNYNSIVRYRQGIERIILAEKEETMEKIQEIIQNLNEIGDNSIKLAMESVKKIISTSIDKSKLDNLFEKNLEESKIALKKIKS